MPHPEIALECNKKIILQVRPKLKQTHQMFNSKN